MSIGWKPIIENLNLNRGDFFYSRTSPTPLPAGTTAEIVWANAITWPATVDGNTVSWGVESELCGADIIPHTTRFDMFIHYPLDGGAATADFHWKTGHAMRSPISP
ncbi:hypothetical protein [Nocardia sp. NBC_01009]|uniref:LtfC-like domain-containing protein n=1 Tax=Nocardia sp. NBC_01009 TaxID=2975996 RepID=UPI00386B26D8|nr:hypothetical protein OHA42_04870 [Nocardia sp. NBC_01009]